MSKFMFEPDKYEQGRIAVHHQTSSNLSTTIRLTPTELRELVTEGQAYLDNYVPPKVIPFGTEVMILPEATSYSHMESRQIPVGGHVAGYQAKIVDPPDSDGDYFVKMLTGPASGRAFWVNAKYVEESK